MATSKTCDRCGEQAVVLVEVKSNKSTPVMADLCQACYEEFRLFLHWLTGQDEPKVVGEMIEFIAAKAIND